MTVDTLYQKLPGYRSRQQESFADGKDTNTNGIGVDAASSAVSDIYFFMALRMQLALVDITVPSVCIYSAAGRDDENLLDNSWK